MLLNGSTRRLARIRGCRQGRSERDAYAGKRSGGCLLRGRTTPRSRCWRRRCFGRRSFCPSASHRRISRAHPCRSETPTCFAEMLCRLPKKTFDARVGAGERHAQPAKEGSKNGINLPVRARPSPSSRPFRRTALGESKGQHNGDGKQRKPHAIQRFFAYWRTRRIKAVAHQKSGNDGGEREFLCRMRRANSTGKSRVPELVSQRLEEHAAKSCEDTRSEFLDSKRDREMLLWKEVPTQKR